MYTRVIAFPLAQLLFLTHGKGMSLLLRIGRVLSVVRALLHDETVYPEPFKFKPERFMKNGKIDPEVRDPGHACWGFGRRFVVVLVFSRRGLIVCVLAV